MRFQPKVRGGRLSLHPSVVPAIKREVEACARLHKVSKSWVVAVALADAFGIDIPGYAEGPKRKRRRS